MILFWLSVTASLVAVAGCGFLLTAAIVVARAAGGAARPRSLAAPSVTVLKPLHGDEPGLLDNLGSFCNQDYSGPIQVVFGVQDAGDGAVAVVEQAAESPGRARSRSGDRHQGARIESQGFEPRQHGAQHPSRRRRPRRQRHAGRARLSISRRCCIG
jgi:cellulose synthase/poly-beta-1,6-N-acetylglucosamine synthase-like glycosyltransferase